MKSEKNTKVVPSFFALMVITLMGITTASAQKDDGIRIRFNGFGDITAGAAFGNPANKVADSLFQNYGEDPFPKGVHHGIGLQGLDLVNTVFLNDNLTIQSEVNLQVPRGGTGGPDVDVERMYVDYKISNKLGLQGGLIFTPIGFINRNLYSRAWLMNSVQMFRIVEEESGIVPNHFIGVAAYGTFNLGEKLSLKYITGLGNARGRTPVDNIYARNSGGTQLTGLLEWIINGPQDFRIGLSGFTNEVTTYKGLDNFGDAIVAEPLLEVTVTEAGFNPYIHYAGKVIELLGEYHYVNYSGAGIEKSSINSLVGELAINTKVNNKRLAPYLRYDYLKMPDNLGPYVGIRDFGGGNFGKVYEADFSILMAGICYDLSSFNRLKIEYARYFDGPFKQNALVIQTAFGF